MRFGWEAVGKAIYFTHSFLCHQSPQRSLFLFGTRLMYPLLEIQNAWHLELPTRLILRKFCLVPIFFNQTLIMGWLFFTPEGELLTHTGDEALRAHLPRGFEAFMEGVQANAGEQAISSPTWFSHNPDNRLVFVALTPTADSLIAVGAFSPAVLAPKTLAGTFSPSEQSGIPMIAHWVKFV